MVLTLSQSFSMSFTVIQSITAFLRFAHPANQCFNYPLLATLCKFSLSLFVLTHWYTISYKVIHRLFTLRRINRMYTPQKVNHFYINMHGIYFDSKMIGGCRHSVCCQITVCFKICLDYSPSYFTCMHYMVNHVRGSLPNNSDSRGELEYIVPISLAENVALY